MLARHLPRLAAVLWILTACSAPRPISTARSRRHQRSKREAGGKIVNFSVPLGAVVRDSTGALLGDDPAKMEQLLGVSAAAMDYDESLSAPTAAGRTWGIDRTVRGDYPIAPTAVTRALAVDRSGKATAWVQTYRSDRPGPGYVRLWGFGAAVDRLPMIRAPAEYGLLR